MTPILRTDNNCQFSNWMSSSQFQCHRDVINDTKVRIGANTSRTAATLAMAAKVPTSLLRHAVAPHPTVNQVWDPLLAHESEFAHY
jgi:hypothetical protein